MYFGREYRAMNTTQEDPPDWHHEPSIATVAQPVECSDVGASPPPDVVSDPIQKDPHRSERPIGTASGAGDETSKVNLRRLEAALTDLQYEAEVCRLPPAAPLPPVPGLPLSRSSSDRVATLPMEPVAPPAPIWLQDHEKLLPPPTLHEGGRLWPRATTLVIACAIAAALSYVFASRWHEEPNVVASAPPWAEAFRSQPFAVQPAPKGNKLPVGKIVQESALAQQGSRASEPAVVEPGQQGALASEPAPGQRASSSESAVAAPAWQDALLPEPAVKSGPTLASPAQQFELSSQTTVASPAAPKLSAATTGLAEEPSPSPPSRQAPVAAPHAAKSPEVALLVARGQQFIEAGDFIAARILFQRAVTAGDAAAAVAMGETYDPIFLAKRGVLGVAADLAKARSWYEHAIEMGSPEGPRRLEMLANR
jgi:hypothetical protein